MRLNRERLALLAMACLVIPTAPGKAQVSGPQVARLTPGDNLRIRGNYGRIREGILLGFDSDSIYLSGYERLAFELSEVDTIWARRPATWKGARTGAVAGFLVGAAGFAVASWAVCDAAECSVDLGTTALGAGLGIASGAVIGATLGSWLDRWVLQLPGGPADGVSRSGPLRKGFELASVGVRGYYSDAIGTGSPGGVGVSAVVTAQRTPAVVTGIEIGYLDLGRDLRRFAASGGQVPIIIEGEEWRTLHLTLITELAPLPMARDLFVTTGWGVHRKMETYLANSPTDPEEAAEFGTDASTELGLQLGIGYRAALSPRQTLSARVVARGITGIERMILEAGLGITF